MRFIASKGEINAMKGSPVNYKKSYKEMTLQLLYILNAMATDIEFNNFDSNSRFHPTSKNIEKVLEYTSSLIGEINLNGLDIKNKFQAIELIDNIESHAETLSVSMRGWDPDYNNG